MMIEAGAQKGLVPSSSSVLTGLKFKDKPLKESRDSIIKRAKATLELESGTGTVSVTEVFSWPNKSGKQADSENWLIAVILKLDSSGWKLQTSERDNSYMYLAKGNQNVLMHYSPGQKEATLYFGKLAGSSAIVVNKTGEKEKTSLPVTSVTKSDIIGNWGNLTGSKINYYDDASGNMIGSGLSKGGGYEFKADGSYAQYFLVTSSRPTYKIFVFTKGTYSVSGNTVTVKPADRHYRKWEYEKLVTNEHSRPAAETHQWVIRANQYTGKPCLYLLITGEKDEREYCTE